ncbi:dual specificity protein phosphatase 15 [Ambystoma mexicanum]|uniref:dual specificity protein phosphatase 15 n=1 Tax=Ambystoma mexicanum TaxID=8296 RepID=UPI0037E961D7
MGNGMSEILPRLYLGSLVDSKDWAQLKRNEITHIVSVLAKPQQLLQEFTYLYIPLPDSPEIRIEEHFKECVNFIHFCRMKGGNCLVHCLAGISRSPTIVAAYIMAVTGLSWRQALDAVKVLRPCIDPNVGFKQQLQDYGCWRAQELGRRLYQRYGENPFNDKALIMALLARKGSHGTAETEATPKEPMQNPKGAAWTDRQEHEPTAVKRGDLQETAARREVEASSNLQKPLQGSKNAAGARLHLQEPLQRSEEGAGARPHLQEPHHRSEEGAGEIPHLQEPHQRSEEGAGEIPHLQEPLQGSKDGAGERLHLLEPHRKSEDAMEANTVLQESSQGCADAAGTSPQEQIQGDEGAASIKSNLQEPAKGLREQTRPDELLTEPVHGCNTGGRMYQRRAVLGQEAAGGKGNHFEGLRHRSTKTPQTVNTLLDPAQGGHRSAHSVLLRMKQSCSCIPRCLK